MPFLAALTAPFFAVDRSLVERAVFSTAIAYSVLATAAVSSTYFFFAPGIVNPYRDLTLPLLERGVVTPNVLTAFGIGGLWSLVAVRSVLGGARNLRALDVRSQSDRRLRRLYSGHLRRAEPTNVSVAGVLLERVRLRSASRGVRSQNTRPISAAPSNGCPHVAIDRFIAESGYTPNPAARWFGAENAENVVVLALDNWGSGAAIEADVDSGGASVPLGVFGSLPDVLGGARWPDPAIWNSGTLSLTADGHGDAVSYLVAKPGVEPAFWEVEIRGGAIGTTRAHLWVTRSFVRSGCKNCVELAVQAIEPTGWASTEGGFDSNHAELRCGDDGRGLPAGYSLLPA